MEYVQRQGRKMLKYEPIYNFIDAVISAVNLLDILSENK